MAKIKQNLPNMKLRHTGGSRLTFYQSDTPQNFFQPFKPDSQAFELLYQNVKNLNANFFLFSRSDTAKNIFKSRVPQSSVCVYIKVHRVNVAGDT